MSEGIGSQARSQPPQQSQYPPPPEPLYQPQQSLNQTPSQRETQPPRWSGLRKAIALVVILVIIIATLYVVFVPKIVEREEVHEAKYEIVNEVVDVDDQYECIDWGWFSCYEYAWIRHVSYSITIRALEEEGDYVVSIEIASGLNLSGETDLQQSFIYENDVRTFYFSFPSFTISQIDHNHNTAYDIDTAISAPKTVEKKKLTIFESLF